MLLLTHPQPFCYLDQPVRNGVRFNPGFPVTCGFLTAVGATQINPGSTVNDPEGACEQVIFSGGGFSNFFALPDYQADAVNSFFANHPPPFTATQFNNSGVSSNHMSMVAGTHVATDSLVDSLIFLPTG